MKATLFAALLAVTLLPIVSQAGGVSGDQVASMLSSKAAQDVIANKEINSVQTELKSKGTTVTAILRVSAQGADIGPGGPQAVPCTVVITQVSVGGFAGTDFGPVQADEICAAASMQ